jgi:ubiquitin-protein ligase
LPADGGPPRLALTCTLAAGAGYTSQDPRQVRLKTEHERLMRLNEESDYVRVKELDVLPGSEPERYLVILLCRGIVGVDAGRQPIYGERHEIEVTCRMDFPSNPPELLCRTPIWHPNINHRNGDVCVNKPEWLGGQRVDDLCRMMFEMVQYKNYHAEYTPPYPLDGEVAQWVREYAEPHGIVDKRRGIFVDNKPFTRPTVASITISRPLPAPQPPAAPSQFQIKVVNSGHAQPVPPAPDIAQPAQQIRLIKKRD